MRCLQISPAMWPCKFRSSNTFAAIDTLPWIIETLLIHLGFVAQLGKPQRSKQQEHNGHTYSNVSNLGLHDFTCHLHFLRCKAEGMTQCAIQRHVDPIP